MQAVYREILLWTQLRHKRLLLFLGICDFNGHYPSIISPWMENGTINRYLELHHCRLVNSTLKLHLVSVYPINSATLQINCQSAFSCDRLRRRLCISTLTNRL